MEEPTIMEQMLELAGLTGTIAEKTVVLEQELVGNLEKIKDWKFEMNERLEHLRSILLNTNTST